MSDQITPGCCTDEACSPATCMQLPAGATCRDCTLFERCKSFLGITGNETICDWFPRKFVRRSGG